MFAVYINHHVTNVVTFKANLNLIGQFSITVYVTNGSIMYMEVTASLAWTSPEAVGREYRTPPPPFFFFTRQKHGDSRSQTFALTKLLKVFKVTFPNAKI